MASGIGGASCKKGCLCFVCVCVCVCVDLGVGKKSGFHCLFVFVCGDCLFVFVCVCLCLFVAQVFRCLYFLNTLLAPPLKRRIQKCCNCNVQPPPVKMMFVGAGRRSGTRGGRDSKVLPYLREC